MYVCMEQNFEVSARKYNNHWILSFTVIETKCIEGRYIFAARFQKSVSNIKPFNT